MIALLLTTTKFGVMNYDGDGGLLVSKEKARLWLKRAAEQGLESATTPIDAEFKCFSCGNTGVMSHEVLLAVQVRVLLPADCQAAAWKTRISYIVYISKFESTPTAATEATQGHVQE